MPNFYADNAIAVEGFNELRRELKKLDEQLPRELGQANKRIASSIVVPLAQRKARGRSNPKPGSAVINSIRALGSQSRVQVAMGGERVPQGIGHEFGSVNYHQFPKRSPRQGRGNRGYFFYPAVRESIPEIRDAYGDMLDALTERAFPE